MRGLYLARSGTSALLSAAPCCCSLAGLPPVAAGAQTPGSAGLGSPAAAVTPGSAPGRGIVEPEGPQELEQLLRKPSTAERHKTEK